LPCPWALVCSSVCSRPGELADWTQSLHCALSSVGS
jgi:hypothetical protein